MTCPFDGCSQPQTREGLCDRHWQLARNLARAALEAGTDSLQLDVDIETAVLEAALLLEPSPETPDN